jgi:hypothetical protein
MGNAMCMVPWQRATIQVHVFTAHADDGDAHGRQAASSVTSPAGSQVSFISKALGSLTGGGSSSGTSAPPQLVLKVTSVQGQQASISLPQTVRLKEARGAIASALRMDAGKLMIMAGGTLIKPDEAGHKELRSVLPPALKKESELVVRVQEQASS